MKKHVIIALLAFASIAFTVSSCNKYVDGPKISLLTKKSRLANTWVIESITYTPVGGSPTNVTPSTDYVLTIEKDEKYNSTGGFGSDSGTWSLGEDKDDIRFLSSASGSQEMSYRILRLKSKELWWKYTAPNGDVTETHFKQK